MSNLGEFLNENSINPDELVARSAVIERLSSADRVLRVERAGARRKAGSKKKESPDYAELKLDKPSGSGRGVSKRIVGRAIAGEPITAKSRSKIARAVNDALASQKKDAVKAGQLFPKPASADDEEE